MILSQRQDQDNRCNGSQSCFEACCYLYTTALIELSSAGAWSVVTGGAGGRSFRQLAFWRSIRNCSANAPTVIKVALRLSLASTTPKSSGQRRRADSHPIDGVGQSPQRLFHSPSTRPGIRTTISWAPNITIGNSAAGEFSKLAEAIRRY
jgi:hypothetical protein